LSETLQRACSVRQLQGAVGISRAAAKPFEKGPLAVISLMVLISVNLGILNLLPIPSLMAETSYCSRWKGSAAATLAGLQGALRTGRLGVPMVLFAYVMYNDVVRMLPTHS